MSQVKFRPDIQGMRAIAVLLVLMAHFEVPPFTGGFVGVDVFFVISGFLITGILWRELEGEGRIGLAHFYARRLKRLLPALLTVVLASFALGTVMLSSFELETQAKALPYALTWTSNLYFAVREIDYFTWLQDFDLYLHTWSLGVEEQFYLLWPLLLLAIYKASGNRRTQVMVLGGIAMVSFLACLWASAAEPQWAFYFPVFRIWEFALGGLVFWGRDRIAALPARARLGLGSVGLALILAPGIGYDTQIAYPGLWAVAPTLGAALLIAGGPALGGLLSNRGLVWIGDRSYSIYLWHWPLFVLGSAWSITEHTSSMIGLIGLTFLLSMATYRWVELPFWKGELGAGWRPRKVFAGAAISVLAFAISGTALLDAAVHSKQGSEEQRDLILGATADIPKIYYKGCDQWYHSSELVPCEMGNRQASRSIVLLGDSIAGQWSDMLAIAYPQHRLVVLTKSSCPMVDEPYYYPRIKRVYKNCEVWRKKALDYIAALQPEAVFVGSAPTYPFTSEQWREGSLRIWQLLAEAAGQVHVIAGTLDLGVSGPGCLSRYRDALHRAAAHCSKEWDGSNKVQKANAALEQLAGQLPRVDVLDLNDKVCPGGLCRALSEDGLIVFRDNRHLTNTFAMSLAPVVRSRIE